MRTSISAVKKLGEVLEFKNGKSIKPGSIGEHPVYGSNGIIGGCDECHEQKGIIVGRVGAYCGSVSLCSGKFWASDNTIVAYPKNTNYSLEFLSYLLSELKLNRWAGGAAQPLLTQTVLKQVEAPIPPLKTQRKIASILSAYDDLIENNLRRIKILEEMAQNLYREWFVNFRFPGHENTSFVDSPLGRIPEGWEVAKVGDVLKKMKRLPKVPRGNYVVKGLFPVIDQGKDFIGGYTDDENTIISDDLPVIIFGDHTRVLKYIDFPFARGADGTQILKSNNERMPMSFLYFALSEIDLSNYAYARHFKFLKDELILLPDKKSAFLFEELMQPNLNHKKILSKVNINLRQTRDLLLPKLISGEVDVSILDINVPEEVSV